MPYLVAADRPAEPAGIRFRGLLDRPQILRMPGAHNGIAALQAERAGFEALYLSGAAMSSSMGLPDLGVITIDEVCFFIRQVARASGLPERRVVFGHALRNAFIPVLTYLGILFGLMLGTAPVTETVFTWPGLGALYIMAIQQLDYPLIMGATMIITFMLVTATLLTDIAYVIIDPRIRLA